MQSYEDRTMNTEIVSISSDLYHPIKLVCCFVAAFVAASLTGCGLSTGGGFVVGTTGYLHEFNRTHAAEVTAAERKQLSQLVREVQ